MFVVIAQIQVKPEHADAFQAACVENAQNSLREPGVVRFDVLRQQDDPAKFTLYEIYRKPEDLAAHKETPHYAQWAEKAGAMPGCSAIQREIRRRFLQRRTMMNFEFATAGRIIFGWGSFAQTATLAKGLGGRPLLVLGRSGRHGEPLSASLEEQGIRSVSFHVDGEPKVQTIDDASKLARDERCDLIIAVGGGSVLDAGKAVAGMATQTGGILDHLEVVGGGKPLASPSLPFIAVPTTAGTGAEVTRNAVIEVPEHQVKVSLRGLQLLPRIAIVDPELTLSLRPEVTAYTGMDALTQLIEPFVSHAANPLTDGFCREGMGLVARSLAVAYREGADRQAREGMAMASLFGGLAMANAKLGAVHGFAGVLGGTFGRPHGAICARCFPSSWKPTSRLLKNKPPASPP